MKYIYGLNISGQSILKYFQINNIPFFAWDDNLKIRDLIEKKYNNIKFVSPKNIQWSLITEAFISPGIDLKNDSLSKALINKTLLHRDLELYSKITKNKKIIAVTGTNGNQQQLN